MATVLRDDIELCRVRFRDIKHEDGSLEVRIDVLEPIIFRDGDFATVLMRVDINVDRNILTVDDQRYAVTEQFAELVDLWLKSLRDPCATGYYPAASVHDRPTRLYAKQPPEVQALIKTKDGRGGGFYLDLPACG